jgi:tetratricopeptide (TPR) repeat protein
VLFGCNRDGNVVSPYPKVTDPHEAARLIKEAAEKRADLSMLVRRCQPALEAEAKRNPAAADVQYARFICYMHKEQLKEGLEAIQHAYRADPTNAVYATQCALLLKMNWRPVEGRALLAKIADQTGHPVTVDVMLAAFDSTIQQYDSAERILKAHASEIAEASPVDRASVLDQLGDIHLHRGQHARAIKTFRQSLRLFPHGVAECRLGEALLKSGKPAEAVRHLDKAIAQNQAYAEAHYYRALAQRRLGRAEEAKLALDAARQASQTRVQGRPDNGRDHFIMARIYTELGLKDAAREYYANAKNLQYTYEAPFAR